MKSLQKGIQKILIILVFFSAIAQVMSQPEEKIRESSSDGKTIKSAISFGLGGNGGYTVEDSEKYVAPTYVDILPNTMDLPRPGPKEVIEELPSSTDYYDGSLNLNSVKIQCTVYQNQNDCLHQNKCGWCGETSSCILGNNLGPLQPCNKLSYVYTYHPPEEIKVEKDGNISLSPKN